jgi:TonB family protein
MKYKITISTKTPEISDTEISQLQNFDALLDKHARIRATRRSFLRVGMAVICFLILFFTVYIIKNESDADTTIAVTVPGQSKIRQNYDSISTGIAQTDDSGLVEHLYEKSTLKGDSISLSDTIRGFIPSEQLYEKAVPVDGYDSLYRYFNRHLTYPQAHAADSIEGIVMISFMIDKDGNVQNIRVRHDIGEAFAQEAIKLIKNMPRWKPATVNEVPVSSTVSIPIKFEVPE